MRKALLVLGVGVVAALAAVMPRPEDPPEPLADLVIADPDLSSPLEESIWYCAWAQAGTVRDSFLAIASLEEANASLTFPVAIPGEPADTASLVVGGPGAAGIDLSEVARRGDSPFFVEFDGGPVAVSTTVRGEDVLAADACVSSGPDVWYFPGGSTIENETLRLRVFNPFSETAKVTITAVSDIGVEALGEYRGISISPRKWRDIDFETELRQREALVISVVADEGLVIPVMRFGDGVDEDWWPGGGLSETWEFPIAALYGLAGEVVVSNPGPATVDVVVDVVMQDGARREAITATVPPDEPARLLITGTGDAPASARLVATGPVAAAVTARGDAGVAVVSGAPEAFRTWLVPGARSTGLERGALWLLNTSDEPVAATVSILTGGEVIGERLVVDPGTLFRYDIDEEDAIGYLVQAAEPITVAWSVVGPSGAAFASASPVPDD
jgi:hypothetical protein